MKNYILGLLLWVSIFCNAQDKILFDYDEAGNQIKRELCLNCTKPNYRTTESKEITALNEDDLQKFFPEDAISFYPNPVKEELYIKWELTENKSVSSVRLFDLNGREMRYFKYLENLTSLNIPFLNYPTGTYLVVLAYNDGEQKNIKIVKQ